MASLPTNSTEGNNWYAILIQSSLYVLLALVAIIGNGLVIFLFTRHKTLRNLPNYLIVDLSIVDLLNSVVNTPLSICYVVLNDPVYRVLALRRLRQPAQVLPAAAQNANSPMARIRRKALYTILIVTFMCVASYLPTIIRSIVGFGFENDGKQTHLAVFAVMICLAIPSALNPFVYLNRVSDFALKVKELKASLCGHRQEENQHSLELTEQRGILGEDHIADDDQIKIIKRSIDMTFAGSVSLPDISNTQRTTKNRRNRDYSMENARVRFLFTS
ncbi:hypothetical protein ACROYT_G003484 [Oculina patagonica]